MHLVRTGASWSSVVVKGDEAPIVLSAMNRRDAPISQPARGCQSTSAASTTCCN